MQEHIRRDHGLFVRAWPALFLCSLGVAAACSDQGPPAGAGGGAGSTMGTGGAGGTAAGGTGGVRDQDGSTDCTLRTDLDTYVANMSKKGKNGLMTFTLVSSTPAPPAKTDHTFKVQISDSSGAPVSSNLKVRVWMPDHNHDSALATEITYDTQTNTFDLTPVSLKRMIGHWQVLLSITDPTDQAITIDSAAFDFCVQ